MPILVGGGGKRVLSIAAREADIIGINPNLRAGEIGLDATKDSLQEQTDREARVGPRGGGRADGRHRDPDALLRRARSPTTAMALAQGDRAGVRRRAGGGARVGRGARRQRDRDHRAAAPRRERWDLSYVVVGDENIDEFAPIVAKLTGN